MCAPFMSRGSLRTKCKETKWRRGQLTQLSFFFWIIYALGRQNILFFVELLSHIKVLISNVLDTGAGLPALFVFPDHRGWHQPRRVGLDPTRDFSPCPRGIGTVVGARDGERAPNQARYPRDAFPEQIVGGAGGLRRPATISCSYTLRTWSGNAAVHRWQSSAALGRQPSNAGKAFQVWPRKEPL